MHSMTLEDLGMRAMCGADPSPATAPVPVPPPPPISEGAETVKAIGRQVYAAAAIASSGASFYHGLKRNDSIGWGLWWGFMGSAFPVITPLYALYEGFGVPKALSKRP